MVPAGIPAAWRADDARPDALFDAGYWADLVAEAERGALDFVTIEDSLTLQSDDHLEADDRVDRVRGVLDAVLIAARIAPRTKADWARANRNCHPHRAVPCVEVDRYA